MELIHFSLDKTKQFCDDNLGVQVLQYFIIYLSFHDILIRRSRKKLKNLLGHKRVKRDWFNAIGTVFETITSVLDNENAEYYNDSIKKLNTK